MTLDPDVKAALLAEIEKALPGLLKRAMAVTKKRRSVAATVLPAGPPPPKRRRLPDGAPRMAILKAVKGYPEEGATTQEIQKIAPHFLKGEKLPDNTLKRWLFILRREGQIDHINGRWFWQPDGNDFRMRERDRAPGRPEDDYQEKDD